MSIRGGRHGRWDPCNTSGLVISTVEMWPYKKKKQGRKGNAGATKDQRLHPVALWHDPLVETSADTRQKRSRHFGVRGDLKASVNGGEQGLFLLERGAAIRATIEVYSQVAL